MKPRHPPLLGYTVTAVLLCSVLNTGVRFVFKLGGVSATFIVATLVGVGTAWLFRRQQRRAPTPEERFFITAGYAFLLGALYALLLALMYLKDEPGTPGMLLFITHYLTYPVVMWLALKPRQL